MGKTENKSRKGLKLFLALGGIVTAMLSPGGGQANERHFTYAYESGVLPKGGKELELWVSPRIGRRDFYSRFDLRAEFEVGLTDRLQTALYLNSRSITEEDGQGDSKTEFEFTGVSSEWKLKLFDPVADALGFALYGEITGSTDELEVEGKLIADKRIGPWLLAANLVAEQEWEFGPGETEREMAAEAALGLGYFLTLNLSIGIELRNHNAFSEGEDWEYSALFLGPVLSYAEEGWWAALSFMPQLPALKGAKPGDSRILDEQEKINARLLFAFHL